MGKCEKLDHQSRAVVLKANTAPRVRQVKPQAPPATGQQPLRRPSWGQLAFSNSCLLFGVLLMSFRPHLD